MKTVHPPQQVRSVHTSKNANPSRESHPPGHACEIERPGRVDHNPLSVTATSAWSPGSPVTVGSSYAASVTSLGLTLFSDNLTTTRTSRVLN